MGRLAPLDEALRELLGRPLAAREREAFGRYLDLLIRWNRTHDLTACRTEAQVVKSLFRDSLLFLRALGDLTRRAKVSAVDIGAGAGIPGLPLRLVLPGMRLTLIEARRKRVSFLRAVQRELGLTDVEVVEGRAEVVVAEVRDYSSGYDVAVARGIHAETLMEVARPFLRTGGLLVAGGPPRPADLPAAEGYAAVEWRRERFRGIRVDRTFLVARK